MAVVVLCDLSGCCGWEEEEKKVESCFLSCHLLHSSLVNRRVAVGFSRLIYVVFVRCTRILLRGQRYHAGDDGV